jgi:serine/threonine protein kinase
MRRTATFQGRTTPEYISPEGADGIQETNKSDMWALGVILYKLVSGL